METALADVARMRLVAQHLVSPLAEVVDVVRHLTCAQGQDFPGSSLSLALRSEERSLRAVAAAYDAGQIVRSWPMRGTLFVVAAEDLGWIGALTAAKTQTATGRRRDELGLTPAVLGRAEAVARTALVGDAGGGLAGVGLTRADLLARWEDAGVPTQDGRGYHHLFHLAVAGVICQGPTVGREQRFVLTDAWVTAPRRLDRAEGVRELLARYVLARGRCRSTTSAGGQRSARRRRDLTWPTWPPPARSWPPGSRAASSGWPPTCPSASPTIAGPRPPRCCCRGSTRSCSATVTAPPF